MHAFTITHSEQARAGALAGFFLFPLAALFLLPSPMHAQLSEWEAMNRGLGHTLAYTLAIDPVDSLRMFCGTDVGQVYRSTDGGFNWELRSNGLPVTYAGERVTGLYLDPADRDLLYAGYSGRQSAELLYKSTDGGGRWSLIKTPAEWKKGGILHVHRVAGTIDELYCGLGWWHGLHRTRDAGTVWTPLLADAAIQVIGLHPQRPSVMLVGCSGRQTLLRSTDSGRSWQESTSGFSDRNEGTGVRAISFSPSVPDIVYIGVTGTGAGLYRSEDAGRSWTKLNAIREISEIAIHPRNESILYISAIHGGVFRSTDRGASWVAVNRGFPTTDIMRVRIAPGFPVRLFAVTLKHGAFRMVDEELGEELFTW